MNGHPFDALRPESVLAAVEHLGVASDGRLFALNSFENRVYLVGREGAEPLVAKFYRPGRLTDAEIFEEHAFLGDGAAAGRHGARRDPADIGVMPPRRDEEVRLITLFAH